MYRREAVIGQPEGTIRFPPPLDGLDVLVSGEQNKNKDHPSLRRPVAVYFDVNARGWGMLNSSPQAADRCPLPPSS